MFDYELQWVVSRDACLMNPLSLDSPPLYLNFGNGPVPWMIKIVNHGETLQFILISSPTIKLSSDNPFSSTHIRCVSATRLLMDWNISTCKKVLKPTGVFYIFETIGCTFSELTSQYRQPFKVIWSFNVTSVPTSNPPILPSLISCTPPPSLMSISCTQPTELYVFAAKDINVDEGLQEDYARLLNDNTYSDFELIVQDHHVRFQCHKSILVARCKVFADFITANADEHTLALEAIEVETVADLLHYIYVGQTPRNVGQRAGRLLLAADKLGLTVLKMRCEETLISAINLDNVAPLLRFTERADAAKLESTLLAFARNNLLPLINECQSFKREMLMDPNFLCDLILKIS